MKLSTSLRASGLAVAVAVIVTCWPVVTYGGTLDPRTVQSETLSNGLRLMVCPDMDSSVVSVEVVVKAGSADEPPRQRGTAHLLEHILWAGAGRGENDPRLRVEAVGGVINGGTLRDFTRFYATVPADRLELAVDALASVVLGGRIEATVLARERQVIAQEVAVRQEDPRTVLSDLAFAALYGDGSPYGSPIEGSASDLSSVTATDLSLFREAWYVPNNMAVIVAGNSRFETARAAVERAFGGLAPSPTPARATVSLANVPGGERRVSLPTTKVYLMAVLPGPKAADRREVCATDLLAALLAHDPTGRLVAELKQARGIASEVGVDFLTQRERSLFGVWAACDPGRSGEVKEAIRAELARLAREPVAARELATAKRLLAAGYAFANETPADRASTLAFYEAIDSFRTATNYLGLVAGIEAENIMETAAQLPPEPIWVMVEPEKSPR